MDVKLQDGTTVTGVPDDWNELDLGVLAALVDTQLNVSPKVREFRKMLAVFKRLSDRQNRRRAASFQRILGGVVMGLTGRLFVPRQRPRSRDDH